MSGDFSLGSDSFESYTAMVTPTVSKKSVTVTADDKTKTYGEENPEFTFTVLPDALVGCDTNAELGITLFCETGQYSSVKDGGYAITGTSVSANYDVTVKPEESRCRDYGSTEYIQCDLWRCTFSSEYHRYQHGGSCAV